MAIRFTSTVEPHEKMRGLEVPPEVVEALGGGKRPRVVVTINGHTWRTRIAIMLGRDLIGFSNANRAATGAEVGDEVTQPLVRLDLLLDELEHADRNVDQRLQRVGECVDQALGRLR